jgi:hypothetical protein
MLIKLVSMYFIKPDVLTQLNSSTFFKPHKFEILNVLVPSTSC